jgi:hypothetical protein
VLIHFNHSQQLWTISGLGLLHRFLLGMLSPARMLQELSSPQMLLKQQKQNIKAKKEIEKYSKK